MLTAEKTCLIIIDIQEKIFCKSKGLVNTREHLESLVESMESGIDTLQDYIQLVDDPMETKAKEQLQ